MLSECVKINTYSSKHPEFRVRNSMERKKFLYFFFPFPLYQFQKILHGSFEIERVACHPL